MPRAYTALAEPPTPLSVCPSSFYVSLLCPSCRLRNKLMEKEAELQSAKVPSSDVAYLEESGEFFGCLGLPCHLFA